MEDNKSGLGWAGLLLFFVVIWILFGAFNGNGFGNRGGYDMYPYGPTGCNCVSNCQVEKQGIIDSARTNFLIEQNGANTRTAIADSTSALMAQNNQIYVQGLQETIFDLKLENMGLKSEANANARFNALSKQYSECCCELNRRLDGIECNMLTKPKLTGVGVTCNGQLVPPITA